MSDQDHVLPVSKGPDQPNGRWVTAKDTDCVSSLAYEAGLFWQTVWNHAANAELKRLRDDPNVLLPGDAVFIPDRRLKEESCNTDQKHTFRRIGEPSRVVVFLNVNDEPLANRDFEMEVDGHTTTGKTKPDGSVELFIPGNAKKGLLKVHDGDGEHEFKLALGKLDPIDSIVGVQQRLLNLGYDCGPADGVLGPRTESALRRFQGDNKLAVNGQADQPTRNRLVEKHRT
jgi:N-acetylmuramoyl-L-alanine amidase